MFLPLNIERILIFFDYSKGTFPPQTHAVTLYDRSLLLLKPRESRGEQCYSEIHDPYWEDHRYEIFVSVLVLKGKRCLHAGTL